eukprot:GHVT01043336.1.p3 GENE.GHVT01043336.1~~GHVT01043336.1.p3  ORF type:complete len:220 (-),score=29.33 GHVT01043336.1:5063-5722(-)
MVAGVKMRCVRAGLAAALAAQAFPVRTSCCSSTSRLLTPQAVDKLNHHQGCCRRVCTRNLYSSAVKSARAASPALPASPSAAAPSSSLPERMVEASAVSAGTLLRCCPPPRYDITVHDMFKVQASLIIDRLPLQYVEPSYERQWRLWKEEWELRTGNALTLGEIDLRKAALPTDSTEPAQLATTSGGPTATGWSIGATACANVQDASVTALGTGNDIER